MHPDQLYAKELFGFSAKLAKRLGELKVQEWNKGRYDAFFWANEAQKKAELLRERRRRVFYNLSYRI